MSNTATKENGATALGSVALDLARDLIARRYGFCVNDSWSGQLAVCIANRTAATGRTSMEDYVRFLTAGADDGTELTALAESILNGETHFLRTAPHFTALVEKVIPAWRGAREPGQRFRIASLGCSTGEEAYSIALALHETLAPAELAEVEITGVDVNHRSLSRARTGSFESFQLRELSEDQWKRWFQPDNTRWLIHPQIRSSVRFLQHNLLQPLPFAGLDAIFCRNVMIYFRRPTVAACLREFHAALRPGGFLFLGHAESAFGFPEYFEPIQIPGGVIYQNKVSPLTPQ
jgi:chemotaxis protein methyltransferase CheR